MVEMHESTLSLALVLLFSASTASAQSLREAEMSADRCMYSLALESLAKAPTAERQSREGLLLHGRLLVQLERGAEAVKVLQSIPRSSKPSEEADRTLALALALGAASRLVDAEEALKQARTLGADKEIVDGAVAGLRLQAGKLEQAENLLKELLSRDPLLSGALYNLGAVRSRQGRLAEAAALIRQAWHAGFQDPDQLKRDPDLEALRKSKGLIDDLLNATIPRCRTY